jgi:hypothetical protein
MSINRTGVMSTEKIRLIVICLSCKIGAKLHSLTGTFSNGLVAFLKLTRTVLLILNHHLLHGSPVSFVDAFDVVLAET